MADHQQGVLVIKEKRRSPLVDPGVIDDRRREPPVGVHQPLTDPVHGIAVQATQAVGLAQRVMRVNVQRGAVRLSPGITTRGHQLNMQHAISTAAIQETIDQPARGIKQGFQPGPGGGREGDAGERLAL